MAKKSMILKQQAPAKFSTRKYNRCKICGRPHAYLRNYGICRICFRELAYKGQIPGVRKARYFLLSARSILIQRRLREIVLHKMISSQGKGKRMRDAPLVGSQYGLTVKRSAQNNVSSAGADPSRL